MKDVKSLLQLLDSAPQTVEFADVIAVIDAEYQYTPVRFSCGDSVSDPGANEGSCKILAFAKQHQLDTQKTLHLFGRFYREDVLQHPDAQDHSNIRNFMLSGWDGVSFESDPLSMIA